MSKPALTPVTPIRGYWETFVWLDGSNPQKARSKERFVGGRMDLDKIDPWLFDSSSTAQMVEGNPVTDRYLMPVMCTPNPFEEGAVVVLAEVFEEDGETPHASNSRRRLAELLEQYPELGATVGFEQEYFLMRRETGRPLGWPSDPHSMPSRKQGDWYCGEGADFAFGRDIIREHRQLCQKAGIRVAGTNIEVAPGQAEFQVGPIAREVMAHVPDALFFADQLVLARWILGRVGERHGLEINYAPKYHPDFNGSGLHTNFSTARMRNSGGIKQIFEAIERLSVRHAEHLSAYGPDNRQRLTGIHETSSHEQFTPRPGNLEDCIGNRSTSVRVPVHVAKKGSGYLEDRRPAANGNPYQIVTALVETIAGKGFPGLDNGV